MSEADSLQNVISNQKTAIKRLEKELDEYIKVEECLVAAGLINEDKIKQAHELVQSLSD